MSGIHHRAGGIVVRFRVSKTVAPARVFTKADVEEGFGQIACRPLERDVGIREMHCRDCAREQRAGKAQCTRCSEKKREKREMHCWR